MKFFDNLQNFVTNLGISGKDKNKSSYFADLLLTQTELTSIYKYGGIGGKVVDCVAEDLGRKWREVLVPEKDSAAFYALEQRLGVLQCFVDCIRWSRLYGGAVVLIEIAGDDPTTPLVESSVSPSKPVSGLRVAHRYELAPGFGGFDLKTGRPLEYVFTRTNERFHASRVLGPVDGIVLPPNELQANGGFGGSVLARCYNSLIAEATAAQGTAGIMNDAKVDVISVKGLSQYLDGGAQQVAFEHRYALAAQLKSITNLLLLDADVETYEAKSNAAALSGIAPLLERFMNRISAETDIPMTRLFGKIASGLSTSGDTNQQDYYDMLTAYRTARLVPLLNRLDVLLCRSCYGGTPEGFESVWLSFRELSEPEQADVDLKRAQTSGLYLAQGAIVPAHVTRQLADRGPYPIQTDFVEAREEADGLVEGKSPDSSTILSPQTEGEAVATLTPATTNEVQKTALNGAQVSSLVEIATLVKTGALEREQAVNIILVSFPSVDVEQARRIVTVSQVASPASPPIQPPPDANQ